MKKLENPTSYFFKEAENIPDLYTKQIAEFTKKLINKDNCTLCKKPFDTKKCIPRIMIHCGHTFCTPCLMQFYMNRRVRCPMCLKLVKHIDNIERLPINHTIYTHIVQKQNEELIKQGRMADIKDPAKFLFGQFERVQKEALLQQNPQKIDPHSGLPFCVFHPDRVQHFYCSAHNSSGCRVCIQIGHSKVQCAVIDLYEVDNPQQYLGNALQARINQPDISQPFIDANDKYGKFMLGLNDDNDFEDDEDSSEQHKSI